MKDAATVRIVLAASREEGLPFEEAWFRALRQIVPPPGSPAEVVAEHKADKRLWREVKPHWRAAYELRPDADDQGLADGLVDARRRLRDLMLGEEERERELRASAERVVRARRARRREAIAA